MFDPRKTAFCNGCLLSFFREQLGDMLLVDVVDGLLFLYLVGLEPREGQPGRVEHEGQPLRLLFIAASALHSHDPDCELWVERAGPAGLALQALYRSPRLLDAFFAQGSTSIPLQKALKAPSPPGRHVGQEGPCTT